MERLVIGAAFVDIKGFPEGTYLPNGRNAGKIEYMHGGVARNVAEDLANAGLACMYLGMVDDTPLGEDVCRRLAARGVNVEHVRAVPGGMGTWLAVFDENGDVAGSISQRPRMAPLAALLREKGDAIFQNAGIVILEMDLERGIVEKTLELAEKYGGKVCAMVSNMSLAVEKRDLLPRFSFVICNQQEAGLRFGLDCDACTPDQMEAVLHRQVQKWKIPAMVVTMGEKGAVYAELHGEEGFCPAIAVPVRDTTGAGDAFCAGVAAGLSCGKSLRQAVNIGTFLASTVIPSRENVCPRLSPEELGLD